MFNSLRQLTVAALIFVATAGALAAERVVSAHLWSATRNGQTIYLQGTIHTISSKVLSPMTYRVLHHAPVVFFEIDLDRELGLGSPSFLPKGQSLKNLVSPEAWEKLKEETRFEDALLAGFSPLGAYNALIEERLAISATTQISEIAKVESMDLELHRLAKAKRIPISTLETIHDQMRALAMSGADLERALSMPREEFHQKVLNQRMATLRAQQTYYSADYRVFESAVAAIPIDNRHVLLTNRNHAWMGKLESARAGSLFVFGAFHLYGPEGVLDLLQKRGFQLHQLYAP